MKRLLVILLLVLAPSVSLAQDLVQGGMDPSPRSAVAPDIFHFKAQVCLSFAVNCGPDNIVGTTFTTYIDLFVPITQPYSRFYIVTDTEGNVVALSLGGTGTLTGGTRNILSIGFTLPPGLYKFISLVIGADGRIAFSDYYRFRVCC